MPICPKCKSEYENGYEVCTDCGVKLEDLTINNEENENIIQAEEIGSLVLLKNVSDGYQKDLMVSFLESEDIPVIGKYDGIGHYLKIYAGQSYSGENLYVLEKDYKKAKELVESLVMVDEVSDEDYILEYNKKLLLRKRILQALIFFVFIAPLLIFFIIDLF